MADLHPIGDTTDRADRVGDVVFVHGLDGDWHGTWNTAQVDGFWPAWLARDCPKLGVWSVAYEAAASGWRGRAMPIADRATNVLDALLTAELGTKPLVFITHSMGGLVVKQLLRQTSDLSRADPGRRQFLAAVRGVVFLATPHTGAAVASLAKYIAFLLRRTDALRELEANAAPLRDLNLWYRHNASDLRIQTRAYFEAYPTGGVRVVDQASADPGIAGVIPVSVDADHGSICKPLDPGSQVYRGIRQFVRDVLRTLTLAPGEEHDLQANSSVAEPVEVARDEAVVPPVVPPSGEDPAEVGGAGEYRGPTERVTIREKSAAEILVYLTATTPSYRFHEKAKELYLGRWTREPGWQVTVDDLPSKLSERRWYCSFREVGSDTPVNASTAQDISMLRPGDSVTVSGKISTVSLLKYVSLEDAIIKNDNKSS